MTVNFEKRTLIRLISFGIAAVIIPTAYSFSYYNRAKTAERALEYSYMKDSEELVMYSQNIASDLKKSLCSNNSAMLNRISSKLWRETGFAKEALDSLPIDMHTLENTNKFLSQTGDFSVSLAKKFSEGGEITGEEREILRRLSEYSETMLDEALVLNDYLMTGSASLVTESDMQKNAPNVTEGFSELEEGFSSYPTLIYDGPFSDRILERTPLYNKEMQFVSRAEAKKRAAHFLGEDIASLADCEDEESVLPSYCFKIGEKDIAVTKKGGLISYMLNNRRIREKSLTEEQALACIEEYKKQLGLPLVTTYYEINDGTLTASLAGVQDDVVLYTDLVKLTVALDNGEIISLDTHGYIINSHARDNLAPKVSEKNAKRTLSPYLTAEGSRLALIPTGGQGEALCHEFKCKTPDGETVLVYLNAQTGAEEQILLLVEGEYGKLTM